MTMNRWRVGSLSMGLVLVSLGVVMLVSMITKVNVLDTILTFWPVILICLGGEILLNLFIKKDDDIKIRYDMLSILFIGFLLFISVCFYALTAAAGMFGGKEEMYAAMGIYNEAVRFESSKELRDSNELVVFDGAVRNITVLSTSESFIRVDYSVTLYTSDTEYANTIAPKMVKFEDGARGYMLSDTDNYWGDRRLSYPMISCIIFLPEGKSLDMSRYNGAFDYDSAIEEQIVMRAEYGY